jgi:hypothetical protein
MVPIPATVPQSTTRNGTWSSRLSVFWLSVFWLTADSTAGRAVSHRHPPHGIQASQLKVHEAAGVGGISRDRPWPAARLARKCTFPGIIAAG